MQKNAASANFDPNSLGIPNGNYFALPTPKTRAALALLPVMWDVTTSYRAGAARGPQAILEASAQVDLYDLDNGEVWRKGIETMPGIEGVQRWSKALRPMAEQVIAMLESNQNDTPSKTDMRVMLNFINSTSAVVCEWIYCYAAELLKEGQTVGIVGGDHSVPQGLIKALGEVHSEFGILHIDAHADLRKAYEGFEYSHASIMYNVLKNVDAVKKLVQVGIRDVGKDEVDLAAANPRVKQFDDFYLAEKQLNGVSWSDICKEIVAALPEKVYISFDIDGLSPDLCPHTGTPVPGGLSFHQASYLLGELVRQGRCIVGFDLCEVAPGSDEWDATVGARVLYKLCGYCIRSQPDAARDAKEKRKEKTTKKI
ncbi:MAG: agmatinase family protein [Prevotellaceae bacterium]|jgi:agmatinase|nr:agmatinase family protein [Prevotellaceae bacterium]